MNQQLDPRVPDLQPPMPMPNREWPVERYAYLSGTKVLLVGLTHNVLVPSILADSEDIEDILNLTESLLKSGSPVIMEYPWIIGSTDRDIFGKPRTDSVSHRHGAWDITPMYNDEFIISPGASVYGLAWNILSLAMLATITDRSIAFIVEGDHLHLTKSAAPSMLPQGAVIAVPTITSWYAVFDSIRRADSVTASLFDTSVWRIFNLEDMSYLPLEREPFLQGGYLKQPDKTGQ